MDVSVDDRWVTFVETTIRSGRFASATDLVNEALSLIEERERKLTALRRTLADSIAEDDWTDDSDMDAVLDGYEAELRLAKG